MTDWSREADRSRITDMDDRLLTATIGMVELEKKCETLEGRIAVLEGAIAAIGPRRATHLRHKSAGTASRRP